MQNLNKKHIKTLVWDVEGVLYKTCPEMMEELENTFIKHIAKNLNLNTKKAEELFRTNLLKYKSKGLTYKKLGLEDTLNEVKKEIANLNVEERFINEDTKLQKTFQELSNYAHVIFSNQPFQSVSIVLKQLGLNENIFEYILTSDDIITPKPNPEGFRNVLKFTNLPPDNHLYIGDRLEVDIIPAESIGMKTLLVSEEPVSGFKTIKSVYEIPSLFT